jgi:hypothetical protein
LTFPIDAVPISGQFESSFFIPDIFEGTADVDAPPTAETPPLENRMLHGYQLTQRFREFAEAIWRGDAIVSTDGSVANEHGTYSFVILTKVDQPSPTVAVKCGGNLPNLAEYIDMDSHQPERVALFAALCFVRFLMTKYPRGPTTGVVPSLSFVLDNKSVAEDDLEWTYGQETSVFDYLKSDYDLLQGIQREINTLPISSRVTWVKGHQDHNKLRNELPLEARANCIADDVCTETHFLIGFPEPKPLSSTIGN